MGLTEEEARERFGKVDIYKSRFRPLKHTLSGNTERAFTLLEAGLSQADWLRDDASLHLVGISDEPEQSSGSYADYIAAFQALKDDPDLVTLHAIGGPLPSGCATADPYTGFYEATVATDGLFLSLCTSDWGGHLTALAEATTANLSSFPLTEWPVPDTIEVRVDGGYQWLWKKLRSESGKHTKVDF